MVTAFVLISIIDRQVHETVKVLQRNPGISELHIVAGEYDLVAVVRVSRNEDLADIITKSIVHAPGVERTKTLFSLESFSVFDLDEIFSQRP
ncbi:MAG: Lrp/AsnC ligand binding domain-containing protein [Lentisphaeria bacterium]|jgi:DNA-binding Lrp family transcriptional regulator|nr:Lrp/AsnC ligand binding domain-containing protein [Lentisphaeria bacterium]MDY0176799.1 Lrp/AsnC ligand binding domain-containing protein [Lentisphaeria bacterium]NLZ59449.1 Lrp/AsnC family transcriptional regulator [Lentisphaerota bacterium]